jgi:hypothetical protein
MSREYNETSTIESTSDNTSQQSLIDFELLRLTNTIGTRLNVSLSSFPKRRRAHLIAKIASASGRHGLSTILHTRDAPRPFRSERRVVEACAIMFPPLRYVRICSAQVRPTLASLRRLQRIVHRPLEPRPDLSRPPLLRTTPDQQQIIITEARTHLVC